MTDFPLEHVSRPPEAPTDGSTPAVLVLHGRGADERDLLPIAAELPDELHVLSARAPDRLGPGFTWYELDLSGGGLHRSQPDAADFRRTLDLVHEFVDAAVEEYGLDPEGVGLLGFSQGAITSLSALIERQRYPWAVALNGYLAAEHAESDALSAAPGRPVFVGAGEHDDVIPLERARDAAETLSGAGFPVTFETYPVAHGTTPQEVDDVAAWVAERL